MAKELVELETLLGILKSKGYQVQGLLFYDSKLKLLGIAPLSTVPDAWVEAIGQRLGGGKSTKSWTELSTLP